MSRLRSLFFRVFVSFFFLSLLFYLMRHDLGEIAHAIRNVNRGAFAAAVFIYFVTVLLLSRRLQLIFNAGEASFLKFRDSLNLTLVGFFFNNFLPTSVGGDIVKAMSASRVTGDKVRSVTCVLMDRIFGLFTFILIPSITLLFYLGRIQNSWVPFIVYSFLALSLAFFFVLFHSGAAKKFGFLRRILDRFRLGEPAARVYEGLNAFKNHKNTVGWALFLSLVGQSVNIFALYLFARGMGVQAQPVYFFLLIPVVHLLSMLPSLNGLGIREGAYVYFLSPYLGREYAAAVGIFWLGLLFLTSLLGGIVYAVRHDYHIRFGGQTA